MKTPPSTTPKDSRTRISRRKLLRGLGATTIALAAPVWRASTLFGQDANDTATKRFIGIFSANGTIPGEFFPSATGTLGTLGAILAPLEAHKARLTVLNGLHMYSTITNEIGVDGAHKPGGPHMKGPGAMLTGGSLLDGSFTGAGGPAGWADRISVDQAIAQRIGGETAFRSLELGVRVVGQEPLRVISYRGADQPNLPIDDPLQVFDRLFAGRDLSAEELAQRHAEQRSVLDFLREDIGTLRTRMDRSDRRRLDAHLDGLRSIEQRLDAAGAACTPPERPAQLDPHDIAQYPVIGRLQMDMMVLAHACDLTRVSTFMWANADSWQYYPWIGVDEEHHALSHAADDDLVAREKLVTINAWHAEQVAYLLDRLAETASASGGTLLDETLVLWGNELGVGNNHTYRNIPWLLAGDAGGTLETGRHLEFDNPHNDLLLTVCHAMGMRDMTSFGIPTLCTGVLPGVLRG